MSNFIVICQVVTAAVCRLMYDEYSCCPVAQHHTINDIGEISGHLWYKLDGVVRHNLLYKPILYGRLYGVTLLGSVVLLDRPANGLFICAYLHNFYKIISKMRVTPVIVVCLFVTASGAWYDFAAAQDDQSEGNEGKYNWVFHTGSARGSAQIPSRA